jgi:hypothetical protein
VEREIIDRLKTAMQDGIGQPDSIIESTQNMQAARNPYRQILCGHGRSRKSHKKRIERCISPSGAGYIFNVLLYVE